MECQAFPDPNGKSKKFSKVGYCTHPQYKETIDPKQISQCVAPANFGKIAEIKPDLGGVPWSFCDDPSPIGVTTDGVTQCSGRVVNGCCTTGELCDGWFCNSPGAPCPQSYDDPSTVCCDNPYVMGGETKCCGASLVNGMCMNIGTHAVDEDWLGVGLDDMEKANAQLRKLLNGSSNPSDSNYCVLFQDTLPDGVTTVTKIAAGYVSGVGGSVNLNPYVIINDNNSQKSRAEPRSLQCEVTLGGDSPYDKDTGLLLCGSDGDTMGRKFWGPHAPRDGSEKLPDATMRAQLPFTVTNGCDCYKSLSLSGTTSIDVGKSSPDGNSFETTDPSYGMTASRDEASGTTLCTANITCENAKSLVNVAGGSPVIRPWNSVDPLPLLSEADQNSGTGKVSRVLPNNAACMYDYKGSECALAGNVVTGVAVEAAFKSPCQGDPYDSKYKCTTFDDFPSQRPHLLTDRQHCPTERSTATIVQSDFISSWHRQRKAAA